MSGSKRMRASKTQFLSNNRNAQTRVLHALINENPMAAQMLMSTSKNMAAALKRNRTALNKLEARMRHIENSEKSHKVKFHRNTVARLQNRIASEPMNEFTRGRLECQIRDHIFLLEKAQRNFANNKRNLRALGCIRGRV